MPYIHCPECFGDPTETMKASWQVVEVEEVGDVLMDDNAYYHCPSCGRDFTLAEFHEKWRYLEEELRLEEERIRQEQELIDQGIIDDYYENDDDEIVDEYGRPY